MKGYKSPPFENLDPAPLAAKLKQFENKPIYMEVKEYHRHVDRLIIDYQPAGYNWFYYKGHIHRGRAVVLFQHFIEACDGKGDFNDWSKKKQK